MGIAAVEEKTVTLADAKPRLSELTELAVSGESVIITKPGRPVARSRGRNDRAGQIAPGHRAEVLAVFRSMAEATLEVIEVSRLDFAAAARFADQHATKLRAGDAQNLAISANHGYRPISQDRGLGEAASTLGVSFDLF